MDQLHGYFITIDLLLLAGMILSLLFITRNKFVYANRFLIYASSLITIFVITYLEFIYGTVIDELGLGGSPKQFFLAVSVIGLAIVNMFVTSLASEKIKKSSCHPY